MIDVDASRMVNAATTNSFCFIVVPLSYKNLVLFQYFGIEVCVQCLREDCWSNTRKLAEKFVKFCEVEIL